MKWLFVMILALVPLFTFGQAALTYADVRAAIAAGHKAGDPTPVATLLAEHEAEMETGWVRECRKSVFQLTLHQTRDTVKAQEDLAALVLTPPFSDGSPEAAKCIALMEVSICRIDQDWPGAIAKLKEARDVMENAGRTHPENLIITRERLKIGTAHGLIEPDLAVEEAITYMRSHAEYLTPEMFRTLWRIVEAQAMKVSTAVCAQACIDAREIVPPPGQMADDPEWTAIIRHLNYRIEEQFGRNQ